MRRILPFLVLLGGAVLAVAHDDDPKILDRRAPYHGPGWNSDDGGRPRENFPAQGVELMSWLTPQQFPGGHYSAADCWGYISPSGRLYALIGLRFGTAFVEITDPGSPVIVAVIEGPDSLWHDVDVYQHYAYAVSEGGGGIQVIDMSQIDSGVVTLVKSVTTGGSTRTHTVFVNPHSGYLYRAGGDGNGLRVYSLADPADPTFVTSWSDRYVHEVTVVSYTSGPYAGKEIALACSGYNNGWAQPGLDILDVTNKGNIVNLYPNRVTWPNAGYSHQVWLSRDKHYAYLNDELDEYYGGLPTTTIVIDVSDLSNPVVKPPFNNGNTSIGHNLYVKGDYIYEGNYTSGLRVFDASDPLAPAEVAWFDTDPSGDAPSFNSLWGNYPYFPNGIVIGSDIEKGLFVWRILPRPGDANCDGSLNGFDIETFVLAVSDPAGYAALYPQCSADGAADLNGDGSINGLDIEPFIALLSP